MEQQTACSIAVFNAQKVRTVFLNTLSAFSPLRILISLFNNSISFSIWKFVIQSYFNRPRQKRPKLFYRFSLSMRGYREEWIKWISIHPYTHFCTLRFFIMAKRMRESSSVDWRKDKNSPSSKFFWSTRTSNIATHSSIEPREMTKKFRLSAFVNREEPSAIFKTILNDALRNWSATVRFNFLLSINKHAFWWKV